MVLFRLGWLLASTESTALVHGILLPLVAASFVSLKSLLVSLVLAGSLLVAWLSAFGAVGPLVMPSLLAAAVAVSAFIVW